MTFRLLACDGGGIRGYLSSRLIQELDTATDGTFLKNIDGYAGTSTGSLISIALATGKVSIADLVDIYRHKASTIFRKTPIFSAADLREDFPDAPDETLSTISTQQLEGGPGYILCQYVSSGLREVLSPYLQEDTFSDLPETVTVAVNTAQMFDANTVPKSWMPVTLNNQQVARDDGSIKLIDAALASAAAPTYFPPHLIDGLGYFADGGTFANDPVLNGIEIAVAGNKATLGDIEVISIGTGQTPSGIEPQNVGKTKYWGAARWMGVFPFGNEGVPFGALFNMSLDIASLNAGKTSQRMLGKSMVRINPVLDRAVKLDDYSKKDYETMDKAVTAAMHSKVWGEAVDMVNNW